MRLIKRYMKRFVLVLCVMALLISCLVFPSSATQIETDNDTGLLHYDLLLADEFSFMVNDEEYNTDNPFYYISPNNASGLVTVNWTSNHSRNFSKIILALNAVVKPAAVRLNNKSLTYVDGINYNGMGDVYYYSYTGPDIFGNGLTVDIDFTNPYSGFIGFNSIVGLLDTTQSISNVDIYREDYFLVTEGYEFTEADPLKNKALPYTFSKFDEESGYYRSQFRFIVDGDDFVSPLVDRASFLFTTCCSTISHHVTLISKDSAGSDVNNLKYNLSEFFEWGASGDYFQGYGEFEYYKTFQIDVDLSGFDMSKYDLMVSVGVDTITETNGFDPCYADLSLRSVSYVPFVENAPWYKTFFGPFLNSIQKALGSISYFIVDLGTSVGDWFTQLFDNIGGWFTQLFEKLEEYFGNDGQLAQAGDQMSDQADQMQQANDSLNSVDKPELQPDALFDDFLNFDTGGLVILSAFTSNAYITQLLVVVFTFALGAFVFFGKRR